MTNSTTRLLRSRRLVVTLFAAFAILLYSPTAAAQSFAYSQTTWDGITPLSNTPGSPESSYALSKFDTVNVVTGHLNFRLPVATLYGRGGMEVPLFLSLERNWIYQTAASPTGCGQSGCSGTVYTYTANPNGAPNQPSPSRQYYSLGTAQLRQSGYKCADGVPGNSGTQYWSSALSRAVVTDPTGTETEFRDSLTGGQVKTQTGPTTGFDRGKNFFSPDGSASIFLADNDVADNTNCSTTGTYGISGKTFTREGTTYFSRGGDGLITEIRDRNGNTIIWNTSNGSATEYDDALGRKVTIGGATGCTNCEQISYPGYQGTARNVIVYYQPLQNVLRTTNTGNGTYMLRTYDQLFPNTQQSTSTQYTTNQVSQVLLPNGQSYYFYYDAYGELARVELPTGGAYEYDWGGTVDATQITAQQPSPFNYLVRRWVTQKRVYTDKTSQASLVESISYTYNSGSTTVTSADASGNVLAKEIHQYVGFDTTYQSNPTNYPFWESGKETSIQYYDRGASGALLKQVDNYWDQQYCAQPTPTCSWFTTSQSGAYPPNTNPYAPTYWPRLIRVDTTYADAYPSTAAKYQQNFFTYDSYNNQTQALTYDLSTSIAQNGAYPSSSLLREVDTTYVTNSAYNNPTSTSPPPVYLVSLVQTQKTTPADSNGAYSNVTYGYDETPVTDPGISSQHDAGYSTSFLLRGNPTTVTQSVIPAMNGVSTYASTKKYDIAGNVTKTTDAAGRYIDYTYASPSFALENGISIHPATSTTYSASLNYDFNILKPTSATDINNVTSYFDYTDSLDRLKKITRPDNSTTVFTYGDTPGALYVTTNTDQMSTNDQMLQSTVTYDGLGRKSGTSQRAPEGSIVTATTYDGMGRVYQTSNPAVGTAANYTTYAYDGLGRMLSATAADGTSKTTSYAGNYSLTSDENSVNRQSKTDGLGRLTEVQENVLTWRGGSAGKSGQSTYVTSYSYSARGPLTGVTQSGQSRTFAYDSLNRLLSATNPENGTISYLYDASGNVTQKADGSGGRATTTTSYDGMNRPILRKYTGTGFASTPQVNLCYDGLTNSIDWATSTSYSCGGAAATSGYMLGHLTYEGNGNSYTQYSSFTSRGQIGLSTQTTYQGTQSPYNFNYTYNYDGSLHTETYPAPSSGIARRVVTTTYDSAGRISTVGDQNVTHANFKQYAPFGAPQQITFGGVSGAEVMSETRTYNLQRNQLTGITAATIGAPVQYNPLSLAYYYTATGVNNSGNPTQQTITGTDVVIGSTSTYTYTQGYTYDAFNRLWSASESGGNTWSQTYNYDALGNRWVTNSGLVLTTMTPTTSSAINSTNNRLTGVNYDSAGNQTSYGSTALTYDAENHQASASSNSPTLSASYTYDAGGRRVQESVNGTLKTYVYDAFGNLTSEFSTWTSAQSKLPAGTQYRITDGLGSTRLTFDADATNLNRFDYLPFGEELNGTMGVRSGQLRGYGLTGPTQKFTGKERDAETGLDFFAARYFSGPQGRFTSPDEWSGGLVDPLTGRDVDANTALPYADVTDPQTLNKYAYVRNNPLLYIDPNGHEIVGSGPHGEVQLHPNATLENAATGLLAGFVNTFIQVDNRIRDGLNALGGHYQHLPTIKPENSTQAEWQGEGEALGAAVLTPGPKSEGLEITFQTYTKTHAETGIVYAGRTSGTGTPLENIAARDSGHHMNAEGYGPAVLDKSSTNKDAIRGREQQLIDANGGAQSQRGTSGNKINGISPRNRKAQRYRDAANKEFQQ